MPERGRSLPPPCPATHRLPAGPDPSPPPLAPQPSLRSGAARPDTGTPQAEKSHTPRGTPDRPERSNRSKAEEAATSLKSNSQRNCRALLHPSAPGQPLHPNNQHDRVSPAGRHFRFPSARCETHSPCNSPGRSWRVGVGRDADNSLPSPRSVTRQPLSPRPPATSLLPPQPSGPNPLPGRRTPPRTAALPRSTGSHTPAPSDGSPPVRWAPSPCPAPREPGRHSPSRRPLPGAHANTASSPPGRLPIPLHGRPRGPPRCPPASPGGSHRPGPLRRRRPRGPHSPGAGGSAGGAAPRGPARTLHAASGFVLFMSLPDGFPEIA